MDKITLNEIKDKLDFFHKVYDVVRLIDPLHKKVLEYRDTGMISTKAICYHYWGNDNICDNCISIRSYQEDRSLVKMETFRDSVILVTAIPITNIEFPAVLELCKNVTDSMFVGNGEYGKSEMFTKYVTEINNAIIKDPLTMLYNRRYIEERLPADIEEAALTGSPLSVCFVDLDNFKAINDSYGHEAGDRAIRTVGEVILKNIDGSKTWAARYGGDEFLICLGGTRTDEAKQVMKRIEHDVGKIDISTEKENIKLSLTFGIRTMEDTPVTAAEIIREADKEMYLEKKRKTTMDSNKGKGI